MLNTDIRFGFWNLRGLNDPVKQRAAKAKQNENEEEWRLLEML